MIRLKIRYLEQVQDLSALDKDQRLAEVNRIFALLFDRKEIVQEVVIDGLSFREAYEPYIYEHIESIGSIELKTVQGDMLVADVIQEMQTYLPKLNRAIDSISDLFYGDISQEGWEYFSQLVEGMQWMVQSLQVVRHHKERNAVQGANLPELAQLSDKFNALLLELGEVVEKGDYVAAGDLMKYELSELFRELEQAIATRVIQ